MITANLLKKPHPAQTTLHFILETLLAVAAAYAQPWPEAGPAGTALAGSTMARTGDLWYAATNPATLLSVPPTLQASYAPCSIGIEGYHEGGIIARLAVSGPIGLGITAQGLGVEGYRELGGGGIITLALPGDVALGVAVSLHSLWIDTYGSATATTFDLGALAHLASGIRFGAAIRNLARARLADTDLPQQTAFGFAFDVGAGTTLSIDARHEVRRPATVALGFSKAPIPELTIRAGLAHTPVSIGLGVGYEFDGISVDYGGAYIAPLGFRHGIGAGIRW